MPRLSDECVVCGQDPAAGWALVPGGRACYDEAQEVSCYERWRWDHLTGLIGKIGDRDILDVPVREGLL